MIHKLTRTIVRTFAFALALCATTSAWAAVKPKAVWFRDFSNGDKRGNYTFSLNNNETSGDGNDISDGVITIGPTGSSSKANGGARFMLPSKNGQQLTVVARMKMKSGTIQNHSNQPVLYSYRNTNGDNRLGVMLNSDGKMAAAWDLVPQAAGVSTDTVTINDSSWVFTAARFKSDSTVDGVGGTTGYFNGNQYAYNLGCRNAYYDMLGVTLGGAYASNANNFSNLQIDFIAILEKADSDTPTDISAWSLTDMTTVSTDINTTTTTDGVNLPASATLTASATPAAVFVQQISTLTVTGSGSLNINRGTGPLYVADGTTLTIDATGIDVTGVSAGDTVNLVSGKIYGTDLITVKAPVKSGLTITSAITDTGITLTAEACTVSFTSPFDGTTLAAPTTGTGWYTTQASASFGNKTAYHQTINAKSAIVAKVTGGEYSTALNGFLATGEAADNATMDVYLDVAGGSGRSVCGVQRCAWQGAPFTAATTGDAIVQIEGGTYQYVFGAGEQGAYNNSVATVTGNTGVTIKGSGKVSGSVFGGWSSSHNKTPSVSGNTAVRIENVQDVDTASSLNYIGKGFIVGGSTFQANSSSPTSVGGNSSVTVALGNSASGTFAKKIVGGSLIPEITDTGKGGGAQAVTGNASVSITAPSEVTFSQLIVGGGYNGHQGSKGSVTVGGNSSVTLSGGTYTGRIVAGSYANVNGTASVAGTATLTLNSGVFTGATLAGGNATGAKTLVVGDNLDISGATVTGFTAVTLGDGATAQMATGEEGTATLGEGATLKLIISEDDLSNGYTPSVSGSGTVEYYEYVDSVLTKVTDSDRLDGNNLLSVAPVWSPAAADGNGNLADTERWSTGTVPADNAAVVKIDVNGSNTLTIDENRIFGRLDVEGTGTLVIEGDGAHNLAVGNLVVASSVTVEVKDSFSITTSIAVNSGVLVLNPTVEVVSDKWTPSDDGTLVVYVDSGNTTTISIPITATKFIKRGAGTLDLTAVLPSVPMVIDAGTVVASTDPANANFPNMTINQNGTFTLKDVAWTGAPSRFSGSGTLELLSTTGTRTHTVTGSSFAGIVKLSNQNNKQCNLNPTGAATFTAAPELMLSANAVHLGNGYYRQQSGTHGPLDVRDLSGSGYFYAVWSSDAEYEYLVRTKQTKDTLFSGYFYSNTASNGKRRWVNLDVVGDGSGTVNSLTMDHGLWLQATTDTSEQASTLSISNDAKVVFTSSGTWATGKVVVGEDGWLVSTNNAAVKNLTLQDGANLVFPTASSSLTGITNITFASGTTEVSFADGVTPTAGTLIDWSGASLESAPAGDFQLVGSVAGDWILTKSASGLSLAEAVAKVTPTTGYPVGYASVSAARNAFATLIGTDEGATMTILDGTTLTEQDVIELAQLDIYYDSSSGVLTKAVAKVGQTCYPSLSAAISDGAAVTLLRDSSEAITLNGESIVFSEGSYTFSGSFTGSGTLSLTALLKSADPARWAEGWTGTVWLKNQSDIQIIPANYGNANSVIRFTGITGWIANGTTCSPAFEFVDEGDTKALTLHYTSAPSTTLTFSEFRGTGTFVTAGNDSGYTSTNFRVLKWSDFTGSLDIDRGRVIFGGDTISNDDWRYIYVSENETATVAAGKTWVAPGGIVVNGTLIVGEGATVPIVADGSTGTVQVLDGASLNIGTARPTISGVAAGGTLAVEPTGTVSQQIEGYEATETLTVTGDIDGTVTLGGVAVTPVVAGGTATLTAVVPSNPSYTGDAWWWDYEFNGTVNNIGSDGTNLGWDGDHPFNGSEYTTADETGNQMLHLPARPWRNVTSYPSEFTAVMFCKAGATPNGVLVAFGSTTGGSGKTITLSTGANPSAGQMRLVYGSGQNSSTDLVKDGFTLDNITSANHLYAFTVKTVGDVSQIAVYADGDLQTTYTADSRISLGSGFQIASGHGGLPSGLSRLADDDAATMDFLRVSNVALSEAAIKALAAEYRYVSPNGIAERTLSENATWTDETNTSWSQNILNEDGSTTTTEQAAPNNGTVVEITASTDVQLTMDLASDVSYEKLTFQGDGAITVKAGGTAPTVTTRTYINTDVTMDIAAFASLGATTIADGKTLTVVPDATSTLDEGIALGIRGETSRILTGTVTLGEGSQVVLPSSMVSEFANYGFALTLTPDAYGRYVYTIARDDNPVHITKAINGEITYAMYPDALAGTAAAMVLTLPAEPATIPADFAYTVTVANNHASELLTVATDISGGSIAVSSGTVELSGDSSVVNVSGSGTVKVTGSLAVSGTFANTLTLAGDGTVTFATLPASALTFGNWTGTVVLPENANVSGCYFDNYGIDGSTVRLAGATTATWLRFSNNNKNQVAPTIEIPEGASFTLASTGFSSSFAYTFKAIKGAGAFTVNISGDIDLSDRDYSAYFLLKDVSDFTGSLSATGAGIAIGDTRIANTVAGGKIIVSAGKSATIASGKTWSAANGIVVNGTLNVAGTVTGGITSGNGLVNLMGGSVDLGVLHAAITHKYVAVSGESSLTLQCEYNEGSGAIFNGDTIESPFIKVESGATLNLSYGNFSGWNGDVCDGYIVNEGTLNISQKGSVSTFFRNHLILTDGCTTTIGGTGNLSLYGGVATESTAQIQLVSGEAEISSVSAGIGFGNVSNTGGYGGKGVGIAVGDNATLTISAQIYASNVSSGSNPVAKYGNGTLVLSHASNSAAEPWTLNAGVIKSVVPLTVNSGDASKRVSDASAGDYHVYSLVPSPATITTTSFSFDSFTYEGNSVSLGPDDTIIVPSDCTGDQLNPTLSNVAGHPVIVRKEMNWNAGIGIMTIGPDVTIYAYGANGTSINDGSVISGSGTLALQDGVPVNGVASVLCTISGAGSFSLANRNATLTVSSPLPAGKVTTSVTGATVISESVDAGTRYRVVYGTIFSVY